VWGCISKVLAHRQHLPAIATASIQPVKVRFRFSSNPIPSPLPMPFQHNFYSSRTLECGTVVQKIVTALPTLSYSAAIHMDARLPITWFDAIVWDAKR
jgi:hypothetical protein